MHLTQIRCLAFLTVLIFLVSVIAMPSNIALAQKTETVKKERFKAKADFLLEILGETKERIDKSLEELEEKGIVIPEEARTSYKKGLSIAEDAVKLWDEGRYREVCEKAIEAMKSFKNVLVTIHKAKPSTEMSKVEVKVRKAIGLKVAIERALAYADKIEKLIVNAEERGFEVSEIKERISKASEILEEALELLDEGKVDDAARKLGEARKLLGEAMAEYRKTITQKIKLKMTERFLSKVKERVEELKEKILPLLEKLPEEKRVKVGILIANATSKIEEAREKTKQGISELPKIMPTLREIVKKIHESKKEVGEKRLEKIEILIETKRLQTQILRLNVRIKLLEKFGIDTEEAEKMLNETRNLLEIVKTYTNQNNLEKAKETVEKAKEIMNKIDEQTLEALKKVRKEKALEIEIMKKLKAKILGELEELKEKLGEIETKITELKIRGTNTSRLEQILAQAKEMLRNAMEKTESGNFTTVCQVVCPVKAVIHRLEKNLEWIEEVTEKVREKIEELKEKISELEEEVSELKEEIAEAKTKGLDVSKAEERLEKAEELLIQAKELMETDKTVLATIKVRLCKAMVRAAEVALEEAEEVVERWISYTPSNENVKINIRQLAASQFMALPRVFVEVTIVFPHAGFRVDWGNVEREKTAFTVDVKVKEWTGPSIQVVTRKTHVYRLGEFKPGVYTFIFKVNGKILVTKQFEVKTSQIPPLKPKIIDILRNPEVYKDKTVIIVGEYCGWRIPENLPGPKSKRPLVTRSDWIIKDGSGWIYVTGKLPDLNPVKDVGHKVTVKATVEVKVAVTVKGKEVTIAYLKAVEVKT